MKNATSKNTNFKGRWKKFLASPTSSRSDSSRKKAPILNFLFAFLPEELDIFLRKKEYQFHQLYRPSKNNSYSRLATILGTLTILFLIYGPTLSWRGYPAVLLLCAAITFNWAIAHWFKSGVKNQFINTHFSFWLQNNYLLAAQWISIFILCAFIWFIPGIADVTEADNKLYRHALIPGIFVFYVITIPIAYLLAAYLFPLYPQKTEKQKQQSYFSELLKKTDLVIDLRKPEITWGRVLRAVLNVPFLYPLYLLFPASIAVIFIQHIETMQLVASIFLGMMWLFLAFVCLHTRYASMLTLWERSLFIRGQFFVSIIIIAIAAGRLLNIDYVTTIIESIPGQVIFFYLLSLYTLLWFYGYWLNHILTERLFQQLGTSEHGRPWSFNYKLNNGDYRLLQIHGGTRFIAIDPKSKTPLPGLSKNLTLYERLPLLKKLVEGACSQTDDKIRLGEITKRYNFYFSLMSMITLFLFSASFLFLYQQKTSPEYQQSETLNTPETVVDLESRLFDNKDKNQHIIFLSASGGGTRAALFTTSLLRGLHHSNKLKDIALVSGVSGGGAALAYFASHYAELSKKRQNSDQHWDRFSETMAKPFIQDVLEGALEWRILNDVRLGTLLKESFQREFRFNSSNIKLSKTFGEVAKNTNLGIILNTSLAGHPYYITQAFANKRSNKQQSSVIFQGGRLIFTNLDNTSGIFNKHHLEKAPDRRFKYIVVDSPDTNLATAAALNANFPPIFSNAAVDIKGSNDDFDRYWVTDGGAVDNRGAISMLLALKSTLTNCQNKKRKSISPIDIIIADASAGSVDFSQNRGIATALSAGTSITNLLIAQLVDENRALYTKNCGGKKNDFHLYYLGMPEALRIRGGMGTHWLMPGEVTIYPVKSPDKNLDENEAITLKGSEVKKIIDYLHQPHELLKIAKESEKMKKAIKIVLDSHHQHIWHSFTNNGISTTPLYNVPTL